MSIYDPDNQVDFSAPLWQNLMSMKASTSSSVVPFVTPEGLLFDDDFPYLAIPPSLREIAGAFQRSVRAPGTFLYFTMLPAISTAFAPLYDIEGLNGRPIPLSIFTIVEAASGFGKTEATNQIFGPHYRYNLNVRKNVELLYSNDKNMAKKLKFARLIFTDPSISGLRMSMKTSFPAGIFLNPDAAKVITRTLLPNDREFCSMFSGEDIIVDRSNYQVAIHDPRFSLCFMTQKGVVSQKLKNDPDLRRSGLIARAFLISSDNAGIRRLLSDPYEGDKLLLKSWDERLTQKLTEAFGDGMQYPEKRRVVPLMDEGKQYLNSLRSLIEGMLDYGIPSIMREEASRIIEKILRDAAIHAIWNDPTYPVVGLREIRNAEMVCFFYLKSIRFLFEKNDTDFDLVDDADDLLKFIDEALSRHAIVHAYQVPRQFMGIPKSYLQQFGPNKLRHKSRLDRCLNYLELHGDIDVVQKADYVLNDVRKDGIVIERLSGYRPLGF